jgi:hypothetical protein
MNFMMDLISFYFVAALGSRQLIGLRRAFNDRVPAASSTHAQKGLDDFVR